MKKGKLIHTKGGMIEAQCPYCKSKQPIGVWAAAHLNIKLSGACKSCGEMYIIGGRS